jgi:hypothetical protein
VNDFDSSGGSLGSWLSDVAGKFFDYKTKTSQPGVRWLPYGADGTQFGMLGDGSIIQRGTPAGANPLGGLSSLLPLIILAGIGVVAYRALR